MAKRRPRRAKAEPPTCNCLLLCDDVLISQGRNKHFLQGVIGVIGVLQLPAVIGGYTAYVRVSNVYGAQRINLSFIDGVSDEVLLEANTDFPSHAEPLGVYTIVTPVPPIIVKHEGRYIFLASSRGVPLAQSPIEVKLLRPAGANYDSPA
jgi:hypothetical protein